MYNIHDKYKIDLEIRKTVSREATQFAGRSAKKKLHDLGGTSAETKFSLTDKNLKTKTSTDGIELNLDNIESYLKNAISCQWIGPDEDVVKEEIYLFDKTYNAVILKKGELKKNLQSNNNINILFEKNSNNLSWDDNYFIIKSKNNIYSQIKSRRIHRRVYTIEVVFNEAKNNNVFKGRCRK